MVTIGTYRVNPPASEHLGQGVISMFVICSTLLRGAMYFWKQIKLNISKLQSMNFRLKCRCVRTSSTKSCPEARFFGIGSFRPKVDSPGGSSLRLS